MEEKIEKFIIESERKRSANERYVHFERELRNLPILIRGVDVKDCLLIAAINHSVLVFALKDTFEDKNETFFENTKYDFYNAIKELKEKHSKLTEPLLYIKLFVEDFYLNNKEM